VGVSLPTISTWRALSKGCRNSSTLWQTTISSIKTYTVKPTHPHYCDIIWRKKLKEPNVGVKGVTEGCDGCRDWPPAFHWLQLQLPVWASTIFPTLCLNIHKSNSIDIKMKKKRIVRHKDVLRNVLLDNLLPFYPGWSCGVTLCIEIQTQRHRDLLSTLIFWFIVIVSNFSINPGYVVGKGAMGNKKGTPKRKWDKWPSQPNFLTYNRSKHLNGKWWS